MYRQVFTPTEGNSTTPSFTVPKEWYGQQIEIIVFPISTSLSEIAVAPKRKRKLTEGYGFWADNTPFDETNYRDNLWQTERNVW